jgi:alkylation response protein AidB-like acyl-CoA dehydrogenase
MFIMMNAARLSVGLEGVAIGERAYQRALGWSRERLQGKPVGVQGAKTAPIVQHPDVKRMLLTMKATTEATRALAYWVSSLLDRARKDPDETTRRQSQAMVDLLIPVVKGWSTENGIEVASLGIQVHGGMGFIEETGPPSTCATRASPRSTKAPPASRPTTWWAARSGASRAGPRSR